MEEKVPRDLEELQDQKVFILKLAKVYVAKHFWFSQPVAPIHP